ncbi:MAG: DUF4384 domain-containing protein [bacterium]
MRRVRRVREIGATVGLSKAGGAGVWLAAGLAAGLVVLLVAGAVPAGAMTSDHGPRVDIWTDRGTGGMYRVGDPVEISVRPYEDCYVMVYEIDTDGYLKVLFPRDCDYDAYLEGGVTYTIGGGYRRLYAAGPSGMEYVHVVASYEPFREIYWHGCSGYDRYAFNVTWQGFHDYWGSALPPRVYGDPYMAMQTIDEFICIDALEAGMASAGFTYFYVGERVHYPRYLCYDCHGFTGHVRPYTDVCLGFSISFVDCDRAWSPWSWWWWSSPTNVYCGPRYVCHRTGHGCSGHHGGHDGRDLCVNDRDRWPDEYKWKSRHDGAGSRDYERAHSGQVDRSPDRTANRNPGRTAGRSVDRTAEIRGGNLVDAARYKTDERSLYSRGEARQAAERSSGRAPSGEPRGDEEKLRAVRPDQVERRESNSRQEIQRNERKDSQRSGKQQGTLTSVLGGAVKSVVGSAVGRTARTRGAGDSNTPKGKTPQVRRGDEGKSHTARRTLSK